MSKKNSEAKNDEAQLPTIKSADDLIVKMENEKLGRTTPETSHKVEEPLIEQEEKSEPEVSKVDETEKEDLPEQKSEELQQEDKSESKESKEKTPNNEIDDYGNPIGKSKTYTETEVQQMIRDRLKRGSQSEQTQQNQQIQDATKDFKADPDSEESWEGQLETFIEKTLSKINAKQQQNDWRQKEEATQAEFEAKFTTGMEKYGDFKDIVSNKPITNSMMLAARSMQDPAAFIYAACKQHPGEVERIAKIQDPMSQVVEIGRLEERMRKARNVTKAPPPPKKVHGDASSEMPKRSIDAIIQEHAKSKIMNVRR